MRRFGFNKALVIFMSLVLVFSSNSTAITPIIEAYAAESTGVSDELTYEVTDAGAQDSSAGEGAGEGSAEDAGEGTGDGTGEATGADTEADGSQASGDSDAAGDADAVRTEVKTLTDESTPETPLVAVEKLVLSYVDTAGDEAAEAQVEASADDEGNIAFDIDSTSAIDLESAQDVAITYSTKISAGWIAGDSIKLYVPNKNLGVNNDRLQAWVAENADIAEASVDTETDADSAIVTFVLAPAVDDAEAGAEKIIDLQIPVDVTPETLEVEAGAEAAGEITDEPEESTSDDSGAYTFDITLALPNSKTATLTLAKKVAATEAQAEDSYVEESIALANLEDELDTQDDTEPVEIKYDAKATATKTWYDGVDTNRPVSELKSNLKIYFKLEDSDTWAEYTADIASLITNGETKTVPEITTSSSANPFTYKAENLPSTTSAGKTISYKIAESKTTVISGETYNIPVSDGDIVTLGNNKYKVEVSADGSSIGNVKLKDFSFTLKMHNGNDTWAPSVEDIWKNLSVTNNGGSRILIDEDAVSITKNDDGTYTVTIANLPEYSSSDALGTEIGYKATLADISRDDGTYYAEYNNAAVPDFGSDTETVHEGGTLDYIRKADATYTMTKEWRDGLSDSALDSEKEKRPDTTFTLWRYVDDGTNTFRNAATVLKSDGTPYIFSANKFKNTDEHTVTQLVEGDDSTKLPKYNADGYEYVYFVRESMGESSLGTYKQVFGAYDEEGGLSDTTPSGTTRVTEDLSIYNGGTVNNSLAGTVETKVTKTWAAAAHQAYLKYYKTVMYLQARHVKADEGEGMKQPWYYCDSNGNQTDDSSDYVKENLYNFASEMTTKTASKSMPRFDMDGYELEYRWVEVTVTQGDSPITEASDPGKVDYTVNYEGATSHGDELTDPESGVTTYIKIGTVSTGYNVTSEEGGRQNEDYYSVTNSTVNGETTTTNKLVGKIDYQVTKKWLDASGNLIEVPGDATYALYKAGAEVATFTVTTAPKQEGSITGADGTVYGSYTVETLSTGVQTITISNLDKYTDGGELVSYFVSEKGQVTAGGVTYAASYQYDNENRTATITNKPGKGGVQIRVEKQWLDDSDTAHRLPVTFEVSYETNDGEKHSQEVTVSAKDNWFKLVGLGDAKANSIKVTEKYVTDTDGTKYSVSYDGDNKETGSLETKVDGVAVNGFKYVVKNLGKQDAKVAGYDNYVSTNRRVGTVNLTVTKTWNDVGATKSERPEANVVLSSSSAGVTVENNYVALEGEGDVKHYIVGKKATSNPVEALIDVVTNDDAPSTDDHTTEDDVVVSTTQNVTSDTADTVTVYYYALPKYDMQGKMITYNVAETLGEDAAEKSYTSTISAGDYTIGSDYHFTDFQTYTATNTRTKSVDLTINKVWNDVYQKSLGHRSDLSLILWQRYANPDGTTTVEKYRVYGYKDYAWAPTQGSTSADALTATFSDLPCYTSYGAEITYFFEESYNNPKATTDYDYNKVKYAGGEVVYLNDKGEVLTGEGASAQATHTLLQAGGTFTNGISSTVTVEGAKVWTNIPSAIRNLVTLPAIKVNVYQQSRKEGSEKKLVATVDSSQTTGKKKTETEAGVNGFISNGNTSNKWEFVVYYEDNDANKTPLPKYDDEGYLYDYTIEEVIPTSEVSSDTWGAIYNENCSYFTAKNEYNDENLAGQVTVTKDWSGYPTEGYDNNHPVVTFTLHQMYRDASGKRFVEVTEGRQSKSINVNNAGSNSVTFSDLAIYAPDGSTYYYYVTESTVDGGYTSVSEISGQKGSLVYETIDGVEQTLFQPWQGTITKDADTGEIVSTTPGTPVSVNVTNTYAAGTFNMKANKYWSDDKNALGLRGDIDIKITRTAANQSGNNGISTAETVYEGTVSDTETASTIAGFENVKVKWVDKTDSTGNTTDKWTFQVTGLDTWAPDGKVWTYKIEETTAPAGYNKQKASFTFNGGKTKDGETLDLTGQGKSGQALENNYNAGVMFTKHWRQDNKNAYGSRPYALRVKFQVSIVDYDTPDTDIATAAWTDATKEKLASYTGLFDTLQASLAGSGTLDESGTMLLTTGKNNDESWTWSNLPKVVMVNGETKKIFYRVEEVTSTIEGVTYAMGRVSSTSTEDTAIRSYIAANEATSTYDATSGKYVSTASNELQTESLTINKVWSDNNNYWGQRDALNFILQYKDGDTWTNYSPQTTFSINPGDKSSADANLWTKTITGLPKEDANGTLYQWRVLETDYSRYMPGTVDGTVGAGTSEQTAEGYASSVTNTLNTSTFKLVKYGEGDTTTTLKNISFKVARTDGPGAKKEDLFTWATDDKGVASGTGDAITNGGVSVASDGTITGLPVGTYTFTEDSSTTGNDTLAKNMVLTVVVKADGTVDTTNTKATAKIKNNGTTVDSKDLLTISTKDGVITLTLTDPKAKIAIKLVKNTSSPASVQGTKFKLYKADNTQVGEELTIASGSDNAGEVLLPELEVGTYYLQETEATPTTHFDPTKYWFQVTNTNGGQVTQYTPASQTDKSITIDGGSQVSITNEPFLAKVRFTKVDASDTNIKLSDAEFKLQYSETKEGTYTDLETKFAVSEGVYTADLTKKGWYKIVETTAPVGYTSPTNPVASFQVTNAAYWNETAKNYVATGLTDSTLANERTLGVVQVTKKDDKGAAVSGVTFTLTNKTDSSKTYTGKTDANGVATISNVAWGTYTVNETVPSGYTNSPSISPAEVTVSKDTVSKTIKVNATNTRTSLQLDKVDADTGAAVNNVTLRVYKASDTEKKNELVEWTRDASGSVTTNISSSLTGVTFENGVFRGLPAGDYILSERWTPAAYLRAADVNFSIKSDGTVKITTEGSTATVDGSKLTMKDQLIQATIRLKKTLDGKFDTVSKESVFGTDFDLYYKQNQADEYTKKGAYSVGTDGTFTVENLGAGYYYFVETEAASSHVTLDTTKLYFEIHHGSDDPSTINVTGGAVKQEDGSFVITRDNKSFTSTITWTKVDADNNDAAITQVTNFWLHNEDTGKEYAITNNNGVYTAVVDAKGSYLLKEMEAPEGYVDMQYLGADVARFTLKDADCGQTLTLKSNTTHTAGGYEITYTDGLWSTKGLQNKRKTGSLSLLKLDSQSSPTTDNLIPLEGAKFELKGTSGQAQGKTYELTTDANGTASVDELPWGSYTLTETQAAPGYSLKTWQDKTFEISATNLTQSYVLSEKDTPLYNVVNEIQLDKVDDLGAPVDGAVLALYDANNTEVLEWTRTDGTQQISIKVDTSSGTYKNLRVPTGGWVIYGLPAGTYTLKEISTPADYVTAKDTTITIDARNGEVTASGDDASMTTDPEEFYTVTVKDTRAKANVTLTKTSAEGCLVAGAQYDLYKVGVDDDTKLGTYTIGEDGTVSLGDLYVGTYYLQETKATYNTKLDTSKWSFAVTNGKGAAGTVVATETQGEGNKNAAVDGTTVTVSNEAFGAYINFAKVDSADPTKSVTGAVFKLRFTPEGAAKPLADLIDATDNGDGTYGAAGLAKGSYDLIEVSAPDGYEAVDNETVATFTITDDDNGKDVSVSPTDKIANDPVLVDFEFTKLGYINETDDASTLDPEATEPLEGAEFTLHQVSVATENQKWEQDAVVTSGADGLVSFANVPEGTYTLTETATDEYHELWGETVTITVGRDGEIAIDPELTEIVNEYKLQSITLSKRADTDGKQIAGSTYELYRVVYGGDDILVSTKTTDAEGKISFMGLLPDKTYRLHEVAAPAGSILSMNDITFNYLAQEDGTFKLNLLDKGSANGADTADINENGELVWNEPQTEYEFVKLDENGNMLAGAALEIQDAAGNVVTYTDAEGNTQELKWTSSTEAYAVKGILEVGKAYKMVETAAPAGYEVASPVGFTVVSGNKEDVTHALPGHKHTVTISMTDTKTPVSPSNKKMPQTGDTLLGNVFIGLVAAAGIGLIAGARVLDRKRR